ncbi:MAG: hypothetical protein WD448_07440 [Woeseia sp.]
MSIWSRRITESAAFWSMLSGLFFNLVPKFFEFIGVVEFPSYLNPVIIGTVVSLVVTLAVSRYTTVADEEARRLAKLHEIPAEEVSRNRTRTSLITAGVLILYVRVMPVLLIVYYVRPFQEAKGQLSADGSIDWFTGEAILAFSWFFQYVTLGLFAARIIRGSYSPPRHSRQRNIDARGYTRGR